MIRYEDFDVLTFDCYGTLIDWETGLLAAYEQVLGARDPEELLERHAAAEAPLEQPPHRRYRDVLAACLHEVAAAYGVTPTAEQAAAFGASVADWPPFPDSTAALRALQGRFRLAVITNCDDDLFEASRQRLAVDFDWVITAEQVGSYKPAQRNFEIAFERIGIPRERILHVAQSLFHDHVTAKRLGLTSVWIDRRHDRAGAGATPPADARPDATFPDMASFAAAAAPE